LWTKGRSLILTTLIDYRVDERSRATPNGKKHDLQIYLTKYKYFVAGSGSNFGIKLMQPKSSPILPNLKRSNNWEMDVTCLYSLQVPCPSKTIALITKT
jgi:hypothetical protein